MSRSCQVSGAARVSRQLPNRRGERDTKYRNWRGMAPAQNANRTPPKNTRPSPGRNRFLLATLWKLVVVVTLLT